MELYIYARKSLYTEESESIRNQIEICKEYILRHISDAKEEDIIVYKDEGFSGKDTNRPEFKNMMDNINKNKGGYIVCYRLDRISRSVVDFANLFKTLTSKQIELICVKEQFDTSTPMGRAMMNIACVFAQMERETLAERIKDNMILLAKSGRWLGGPTPTGFSSEKTTEFIDDGKIKSACYLKENGDIEKVKLIFEKFLELGSLSGVAKFLTQNQIKSVNQYNYDNHTLKLILTNPVYCTADKYSYNYFKSKNSNICFDKKDFSRNMGIIPFNRHKTESSITLNPESSWLIALGKHKGVIEGRDWVAVQNVLIKTKSEPYSYVNYALLSGVIECNNCGSRMYVRLDTRYKRGTRFYYGCIKKFRYGLSMCNGKNLIGVKTDEEIVDYIINYDETKLLKNMNIKKINRKVSTFKDKAEEIHFEICSLRHAQNKYIEHLLELDKNSCIVKKIELKVKELEVKIEKLQTQKRMYECQSELAEDEKSNVEQVIKNLRYFKKNFYTLAFDEKKSLLRLILKKIIWNGSKLDIILNGEQE